MDNQNDKKVTKPEGAIAKSKPTTSRISLASSRQSMASNRQSMAISRQSLARSRQSLAESTQSLVDSRTNLPSAQKPLEAVEPTSKIPIRPSFVETPGVESKLHQLQFQQELDNKNLQLRDLEEKIETLKIKRMEDKGKLKDFDKVKIQLEHMIEFKNKIMKSQVQLQDELQNAKREAKEAIEAKQYHADEMTDFVDTVEMVTLDKEMAEERAETLQLELDTCKQKLEEVTLDYEIIKDAFQELPSSAVATKEGDQLSTYEIKQLKSQNDRLHETLVKMRDLSVHEKYDHQKLLKDIDYKNSEVTELTKTKKTLHLRVEQMTQQIADLQEQVDAALGAEEMVLQLGKKNFILEDKVSKLEEEIAELEALKDMNDEIAENNAELEVNLREELDMSHSAIRKAVRDRDAAIETISDREMTINKFRELVQKLQEQSHDLHQRLEKESTKPVSSLLEIQDFKRIFTETKAHTKSIDLELRSIHSQQLQQHITYLSSYMPDTFMSKGGDNDAISILLLIPRLMKKLDILVDQISSKFSKVDKLDRLAITADHSVEQFAFRCRINYYIYALKAILHQYLHGLNICKPETLLKVGSAYPEISLREKIIDGFVELAKRNQLDENIHLEPIEKCVYYFNTMYEILLEKDIKQNYNSLLSDNIKAFGSACECINNDAVIIRNLLDVVNMGEIGLLVQYVISKNQQLQQQLKHIKRRIPSNLSMHSLGLNKEVAENLHECYQHIGKIMRTLRDIVKNAVAIITESEDVDINIPQDKMMDLAINASNKVYEQDDLGPVPSMKASFTFVVNQITQIAQFLQDNEHDISLVNKKEAKRLSAIEIRAQFLKKELEENTTLTIKLKNSESHIKILRKQLKEQLDRLSEMTIRKELSENKLRHVKEDYELKMAKLQRKIAEADSKERDFKKTLDVLQNDIDTLENEKRELEKLGKDNEKNVTKSMLVDSQLPSLKPSLDGLTVVRDSPLLLQEISGLRKLFNLERDQRISLQNEKMLQQLRSLEPLPTFKEQSDEVLNKLIKEGTALKQEILLTLAKPTFPPVYMAKPGRGSEMWQKHFAEENDKMLNLKRRAEEFQTKVADEVIRRKFGGQAKSDFMVFPTPELTKALKETKPVSIGSIKFPLKCSSKHENPSSIINLEVDYQNLQKLLNKLLGIK